VKIWIDLATAPQVLFFRPILRQLENKGHTLSITARDYAQTIQLAEQLRIPFITIGRHGGSSLRGLITQIFLRSFKLAAWARKQSFDLCISHNSYSQVTAAWLLKIPSVTLMDYEHQPLNHLCFRLAGHVLVPEPFPEAMLIKFGAAHKYQKYHGVKEQIYLHDFQPDPDYRTKVDLPADSFLVVVRPPATWAAYHRFENDLFDILLERLNEIEDAYILFVPRLPEQNSSIQNLPHIHPANRVYDGPNLIYHSDMVVSGGGTMNREAAVIGTRTYTIFKGRAGSADDYLIDKGRMHRLADLSDLNKMDFQDRSKLPPMLRSNLLEEVTDLILQS
jgi:predicted glycosyltransferase